ncbi:hypothetical protein [Siphonobacter sp. SORGH_AS_1065]|uniref:hypothetical protein n=1 Tax=Siphonobacter sp. SORGH_AS_1065 TaxID=3041795 RepID=UPI00277FC53B|nr:hypothetical protein [Siphonobacter sp. SORGH_AS_1065]MDQ1089332.1 hypothetical protein [Siphonobacter sp. SORGH_AS_1065]
MKNVLLILVGLSLVMSCKKEAEVKVDACMNAGATDVSTAEKLLVGIWQLKYSRGWTYSEDVPSVVLNFRDNKQVTVSKNNQVIYKGVYGIRSSNQSLFLMDSSGKYQYRGTDYLTGQIQVCEQNLIIDQGSAADWPIYGYTRKDTLQK